MIINRRRLTAASTVSENLLLIARLGIAIGLAIAAGVWPSAVAWAADAAALGVSTVHLQNGGAFAPPAVSNFRCHIALPLPPPGKPAAPPAFPDCDTRSAETAAPHPVPPLPAPPCINGCGQIQYNNGPVITSSTQFFIWLNCPQDCLTDWGNPAAFIDDYFNSNFIHVLDQYMAGLFVTSGSNKYTSHANTCQVTVSAPHVMSDSDVHNYIMTCINQYYNKSGGGGGYNQMYTFFLPPGQDLCMGNPASCYCPDNNSQCTSTSGHGVDFCGYHASFDATDATNATIHVIYQAMPYDDVTDGSTGYGCQISNGPNGGVADSENNILTHELAETITDPDLGQGWVRASDNSEVGDICNFMEKNPIYLDADAYSVQMLYSNQAQNCVGAYKTLALTHDFNFDMMSDILWHDTSGDVAMWLLQGAQVLASSGVGNAPTVWSVVGERDFNGDGKADVLWHDTSGDVAIWFMNGAQVTKSVGVGNAGTTWSVAGTGDFFGNGNGDILWHDGAGDVAIWEIGSGGTVIQSCGVGNAPTTWSIAGTGAFNAGAFWDILWHDSSGNVAMWFMDGCSVESSSGVGNAPTSWSIVGTGDFNGDGFSDILWRDTSGDVAIWEMNGSSVVQSAGVGNVPAVWSVAETGDYNGDAKSDILWRDTGGDVAVWELNGASVIQSAGVGSVSTVWSIQGAGAD